MLFIIGVILMFISGITTIFCIIKLASMIDEEKRVEEIAKTIEELKEIERVNN